MLPRLNRDWYEKWNGPGRAGAHQNGVFLVSTGPSCDLGPFRDGSCKAGTQRGCRTVYYRSRSPAASTRKRTTFQTKPFSCSRGYCNCFRRAGFLVCHWSVFVLGGLDSLFHRTRWLRGDGDIH
jgi:hypothetical protein